MTTTDVQQNEACSENEDTLADTILELAVPSKFEDHEPSFYPNGCIERLVTEDSIRKALRPEYDSIGGDRDESFERLVTWIFTNARKLLALVSHCGDFRPEDLESIMMRFNSPATLVMDETLPIMEPSTTARLAFKFNLWSKLKRKRFYDEQWSFLSPVFCMEKYWYDLEQQCIMPFIDKKNQQEEGGFSNVFKVEIHDAHDMDKFKEVAIKQLKLNVGQSEENMKVKVEEEWGREARSLERINGLGHPHVIKCYAAIRRGDNRYFMFPWADGGSLREFWKATPAQKPKASTIRQAVRQLRGLADALDCLHNLGSVEVEHHEDLATTVPVPELRVQGDKLDSREYVETLHIRHGDIKPENILRFDTSLNDPGDLGTLKLADMGLAKQHIMATVDRRNVTSTRYGTIRYEAPEARTSLREARSRLYDTWSMGCVTLEYIIWILYGHDALQTFYSHFEFQPSPFYKEQDQAHAVHPIVKHWISHIETTDPECTGVGPSAVKDLLALVRDKLLVIHLDPRRNTKTNQMDGGRNAFLNPLLPGERRVFRATAAELRDALDSIMTKMQKADYVLTGKPRGKARPPGDTIPKSNFLDTPDPNRQGKKGARMPRPQQELSLSISKRIFTNRDYDLPPLKDWEFPVDNEFAKLVLDKLGTQIFRPFEPVPARLCSRCRNINFWVGNFTLEESRTRLHGNSAGCQFCTLLLEICETFNTSDVVRFERKESTLRLSDIQPQPVLSIFRSPELQTPTGVNIQLGLLEPLQPGSGEFYQLLRLWLSDCNQKHPDCCDKEPMYLPTRLIDVGTQSEPTLRLLETSADTEGRYIALSHPWGDSQKHPPFTTTRQNIKQFKSGIDFYDLPRTLKDAVVVTRNLGIRYLWADTLCIIQGDDGDFGSESKRMEDVYSRAYCVIAANRASGTHDGFLHPLPRREYLTFQRGAEHPFYMCRPVDDFSGDVLQSYLAKRGWVFQERALARRTIFFAENQTYFECGKGVRCQTLSRMHSNLADFLGDPKFPAKAMRSSRGVKIRYFQDLYRQYSRLDFSRASDRPFAIDGLERRLRRAYGTSGGWGIFDDGPGNGLFHRSLLWRRGDELVAARAGLTPIAFPEHLAVAAPSWSWMARGGAVDYFDPPFQATEWETRDIEPPWTRPPAAGTEAPLQSGLGASAVEIRARVRDFDVGAAPGPDVDIVYDEEPAVAGARGKGQCVVVARGYETKPNSLDADRAVKDEKKTFYVLTVSERPNPRAMGTGTRIYQRTGAGYMLGKYISLSGRGVEANIC